MKTDVAGTNDNHTVTIDLQGLKKENIATEYSDGILSVSGKAANRSTNNQEGEVIHSKRYYGTYSRQYRLPNVDRDEISASYDGGVLKLNLPKTSSDKTSRKIEIQ